MNEAEKFAAQVAKNIEGLVDDHELRAKTVDWMVDVGVKHQYSYNFS